MLLKLKQLLIWHGSIRDWYREVWQRDPDARMCCTGYHCGCQGATNGEYWKWQWEHRNAR
jgi:hypothetical protein